MSSRMKKYRQVILSMKVGDVVSVPLDGLKSAMYMLYVEQRLLKSYGYYVVMHKLEDNKASISMIHKGDEAGYRRRVRLDG